MSPWMTHRLFDNPKALLAETQALRVLAHSLVGDAHTADDLVQGTWLTAMGRGFPDGEPRSWLRGILRNLFRQERRATHRRSKREKVAARPEADPEDGTLERLEALQAVVEAMRGLPEPYRGTVVARFFEGLRPSEIARRQELPAATVRTRLHRALGMLREVLDRRFAESRRDWRRSLLLLTPHTLIPTVVMSTKLKIAAVLLVVLGLFWSMTSLFPGAPDTPVGSPPSAGEQSASTAAAEPAVAEGAPDSVAMDREELPVVETAGEPEEANAVAITGIVSGDSGEPLAGARVWVGRRAAATDEHGHYQLAYPRNAGSGFLYAAASGHATARRIFNWDGAGEAIRVDFDLRRGFRIRGRITDAEGLPVEGAEVDTFFNHGDPVRADAEGHYILEGLDPGRAEHILVARKEGFVRGRATVATEGEETIGDLVLERGNEVRGIVLGPRGEPIAGAEIYIGFDPNDWDRLDAETGATGSFRFPAVQTGERRLVVQHDDYAPVTTQVTVVEGPENMDPLQIELSAGRSLEGRVVDQRGRPLEGVSLRAQHKGKWVQRRTQSGAEGRFFLDHLPEEELSFTVARTGYLYLRRHEIPPGVRSTEIVLSQAGELAGRVLDGRDGSPLRGFTVRLVPPALQDGEERFLGYGATWAREGHQFSDTNGYWSTGSEDLQPGAVFGLELRAEGFATKVIPRAFARVEADPDVLVVSLYPGTRLYGQVIAATGDPVSGARVTLRRLQEPGTSNREETTHDLVMTHTDATGQFELRGLADGELHLAVEHPDWAFALHGPIQLLPGQVEQSERVQLDRGLVLTGQLRDGAGRPRPHVEMRLEVRQVEGLGEREWATRTDDQGRYRFEQLPEGVFRLRDHYGEDWAWGSSVGRYVEMRSPGPVLWDLEPASHGGAIHGRLDLPPGHSEPVTVRIVPVNEGTGEELRWEQLPMPRQTLAVDGEFAFSNLPPGRYGLSAMSWVMGVEYSGVLDVEVRADERQDVRIEVRR